MIHLGIFLGLAAGNIVYQYLMKERHWWVAIDRCFFQGIAVLLCYLAVTK